MEDYYENYLHSKLGYAKSQEGFERVDLKSEVWNHFKQNKQGLCRCNHCGLLFKLVNKSSTGMLTHLNRQHAQQIFGVSRTKKEQEQIMNDFMETLVLQGYPIDKIIDGLTKLFLSYKSSFHQLMNKFIGNMPQIRQNIQQILQVLPIDTDKHMVEQLLIQFFPKLSRGTRKSLIQEYFWIYSNQEQILLNFKQHGYNIITLYDQDNLNLMMLVTDSMRNQYFKYADCLNIDVVDKVFKKKSPYGFAEYSTWFFTGQNQNLQIVLFGFAITNEQNDKNIQFLFQNFFKQMNYIYPISICIPPYIVFHEQIKKAAPTVLIIVNWYHKLKFLKQLLKNQIQQQNIIKSICDCLITQSKAQFDFLISKIMSKVSDQKAIKYGVQHQNQNFCIHKIPLKFIGFSIQVKRYKDLQKHVRDIFIYQGNLARLFIYVIKLDKKLNYITSNDPQDKIFEQSQFNKSYFQSSSYHSNSKIIQASNKYMLSQNVKQRISLSLHQLGAHKIEIVDPITVRFSTRKTHVSKWKAYTLIYKVQYNYWECNCRYLKHTGVPCAHLIKVLQKFGGDYRIYVNPRWFIK